MKNLYLLKEAIIISLIALWSVNCQAEKLNKNSVYEYAIEIGVKYPTICAAQAIHETASFTSYGCRKRHNLFGFGGYGSYKRFKDWHECVQYYKYYQEKKSEQHNCCNTYFGWFKYVSHHFAADKHYGQKLAKVIKISRFKTAYKNFDTLETIKQLKVMKRSELVCEYKNNNVIMKNGVTLPTRAEIKSIVVDRPRVRVDHVRANAYAILAKQVEAKVNDVRMLRQEVAANRKKEIRHSTNMINTMFNNLMNVQEND